MDERSAEVVRVLRVLAAHAAAHARASAAEAQDRPVDAYEVLGVEPDTPAGERTLGGQQGRAGRVLGRAARTCMLACTALAACLRPCVVVLPPAHRMHTAPRATTRPPAHPLQAR